MQCPRCHHAASDVFDTRATGATVRRRRKCARCQQRWTTYEVGAETLAEMDLDIRELIAEIDKRLEAIRKKTIGTAQPGSTHEVTK